MTNRGGKVDMRYIRTKPAKPRLVIRVIDHMDDHRFLTGFVFGVTFVLLLVTVMFGKR